MRETSLEQFYDALKAQIEASEPGVTLNKIDRPQIELIRERALQRLDQYRKRMKSSARAARSRAKPDYSYDRDNFRPLGLQLFLEQGSTVAHAAARMSLVQRPRLAYRKWSIPSRRRKRVRFWRRSGRCSRCAKVGQSEPVLMGFRPLQPDARQFQLPQDDAGARLRQAHRDRHGERCVRYRLLAFTERRSKSPSPPLLQLSDQHLIISCDATQATAIARARTGASYIIEGPPGTGKSQTITNLIADYVARGKRVLFVCEKRAAIDVVFHRLRQQGLDELCCLIHDSQTDKKAFIQDLKQTYERFSELGRARYREKSRRAHARTACERWSRICREPARLFRRDATTPRKDRHSAQKPAASARRDLRACARAAAGT